VACGDWDYGVCGKWRIMVRNDILLCELVGQSDCFAWFADSHYELQKGGVFRATPLVFN
jgi:hypothetical protein